MLEVRVVIVSCEKTDIEKLSDLPQITEHVKQCRGLMYQSGKLTLAATIDKVSFATHILQSLSSRERKR